MEVLTVKKQVSTKIAAMLEKNSGLTFSKNELKDVEKMVTLLQEGKAKILSTKVTGVQSHWIAGALDENGRAALDGNMLEFCLMVEKGQPCERDLVDILFYIQRVGDLHELKNKLKGSAIRINV